GVSIKVMAYQGKALYEFGGFRLDADRRLLFREGETEPVELTPKVFDTLLFLLQNSQRVVEKKELMDSLWPDSFVEESNLFQNISTLRKALGENPQAHQFIVTVPGRGYRFVSSVRKIDDESEQVVVREQTTRRIIIKDSSNEDPESIDSRDVAQLVVTSTPGKRVTSGTTLVVATLIVAVAVSAFG